MARVNRPSVNPDAGRKAAMLLALLCRVMMVLTQRLPIVSIPKQRFVAFVRHDVIDHRSRGDAANGLAHPAQRVLEQICRARVAPTATIQMPPRGARIAIQSFYQLCSAGGPRAHTYCEFVQPGLPSKGSRGRGH
jgi:hypothetical protein